MGLTQIRREREGASQWGMWSWVVPTTTPTVEDEQPTPALDVGQVQDQRGCGGVEIVVIVVGRSGVAVTIVVIIVVISSVAGRGWGLWWAGPLLSYALVLGGDAPTWPTR